MAAGLGTRMKSNRAKVLHQLGGLPLITHVSRAAQSLSPKSIVVVVGHQAEEVEKVVREDIGDLALLLFRPSSAVPVMQSNLLVAYLKIRIRYWCYCQVMCR